MYLFVYNLQIKIRISAEYFLSIFQFINDLHYILKWQ